MVRTTTIASRTLAGLLVFGAFSSLIGAVMAVAANGAGVPVAYLANSPFTSFLVPGLILGLVVGGSQLAAAIVLLAKGRRALLLSAVAGFGMSIWVFTELAMMTEYSPLQTVYYGLGTLELILVLALLGIVPTIVRPSASR